MFPRLCPCNSGHRPFGVWVLLWVLALVPVTADADEKPTWADNMLSVRKHDFGSPAAGTKATFAIKISNIYKETVTISEVTSTSEKVKARVDQTSLLSKEAAQLELTLDPTAFGKPTTATVSLKMTFDGGGFATVTVPVTAFPKPVVANTGGRNWAEQMFSELKADLGPVAKGAEVKHVITVTNLYEEDVTLTDLVSSCACISPQLDMLVLKSKQTAQLTLSLDTVRFSGKREGITVSLNATFDHVNYKSIRIPVTAYIRQDVVFEPGSVQFGTLAPGEAAERRVRVVYAGRNNWTVRSVRGTNPNVTSEVKEVLRDPNSGRVEYELLVKVAGTAPLGPILDQLVLETDDTLNPKIPVLVGGLVEADLQITPALVQFGTLQPGLPKAFNVVVKGRKPFRIEKVECDSTRKCFDVSLPQVDKTVHVVGLTVTPPDEPGEFKEAFTVTIAGRPVTLAFQGVGVIAATAAKPAEVAPVAPEAAPAPEAKDSPPAEAGTNP